MVVVDRRARVLVNAQPACLGLGCWAFSQDKSAVFSSQFAWVVLTVSQEHLPFDLVVVSGKRMREYRLIPPAIHQHINRPR